MASNSGWAFWLRRGGVKRVCYVAVADLSAARAAIDKHMNGATMVAYNRIPPEVREFLALAEGQVLEARVTSEKVD